jgi:hypothetical protein
MPADVIERLRAADPARDIEPHPPELLLAQLKAAPRPARRSRRRRVAVLLPVAVAAAATAVLALPGTDAVLPGVKTSLAARAYAQTAPEGDRILYVHTTIETQMRTPTVTKDTHAVRERWQRDDRWRERLDLDGEEFTQTLGADGVLRFSDGTSAPPEYLERLAPDFVSEFRKRYERGTLDESATATFNGRPARKYVIDEDRNHAEYFLDADTGMPLGSVERFAVYSPTSGESIKGKGPNGSFTATTIVDAIEQLPATPANLGKLSG